MTMTSVTVRVDAHTKEQAANIAEDFGLDLSSVTRAFYRQIVREHGIPLNLFYPDMPQETAEALDEARAIASKKSARFDNADEMFESLDSSHVEQRSAAPEDRVRPTA